MHTPADHGPSHAPHHPPHLPVPPGHKRIATDGGNTLVSGELQVNNTMLPTTVYVRRFESPNSTADTKLYVAGFGAERSGTFYQGGVTWNPGTQPTGTDGGMFFTFVLLQGIDGVDCDALIYSVAYLPNGSSHNHQLMSVPVVPDGSAPVTYDFEVDVQQKDAELWVDPKIIVTPIT